MDNADAGTNVDLIASVAMDRGDLEAGGAEQGSGPANARFFVWFEL